MAIPLGGKGWQQIMQAGRDEHCRIMFAPVASLHGRDLDYRFKLDAVGRHLDEKFGQEFERLFGRK